MREVLVGFIKEQYLWIEHLNQTIVKLIDNAQRQESIDWPLIWQHANGPALLLMSYGIAVIFVYWLQRTVSISLSWKRFLIWLPIAFFFITPVFVRQSYPPIVSFLTGSIAWILSLRCIQTVLFYPPDYFPNFWRFIVFNFVDYFPPSSVPHDSVFVLVKRLAPRLKWGPRRVGVWLIGSSCVRLFLFLFLRHLLLPYRSFFLWEGEGYVSLPSSASPLSSLSPSSSPTLLIFATRYFLLSVFSGFEFILFYLFGSTLTDFGSGSCSFLFGVHMAPFFRFPLLSTSPLDFWNNRWNLYIRGIFHRAIFRPFLESYRKQRPTPRTSASTPPSTHQAINQRKGGGNTQPREKRKKGPLGKRTAYLLAFGVFVMSGIMHEHVYYCVFGEVTGENILFFVIHGIACALQTYWLQRNHRQDKKEGGDSMLRTFLCWLLNSLFMLATAPLFFAPFIKHRMIL